MIDIKDILRANARLAVLRFLADDGGYRLSISLLQDLLGTITLDLTRAEVETLCDWLAERDLVTIDPTGVGDVTAVRLTPRGADVVAGRVVVAGVKRPSPGDVMSAAANGARSLLGG